VPAESEAVPNGKVPAPPTTRLGPRRGQVMVWLAPLIVILTGEPDVAA